jgi:signal transduction histidine kinase/FixJ family two-component response regulator
MGLSPPTTKSSVQHAQRRRIRLLVVDDSLDHRALIARRLEAAGMQVRTASSAEEALEQVEQVDLVLLDYRLPGVDGLDLLRVIHDRPRAPSVIMVTGAGSTEVAVDAMRAGAINYVPKDHGYVEALPEVVERAWLHHDLAARATELQRLALLVTSATDRDQLFQEIVDGAARLLHAESCALLIDRDGRLEAVSGLGPERDELSRLIVISLVDKQVDAQPRVVDGHLFVPLPSETGEPVGLLALSGPSTTFTEEELQLSRAFASFAGIALRKLRQFELERILVSELQQTLDARRDFVASISHELRTPLTSICGFTQTLRIHWEALEEDRRRDLLERVDRNADDLRDLVDELLDLARLERGRAQHLQLESLDLRLQTIVLIDQLGHVLEDRDVRVAVPHLAVTGDASLLRRTLGNLLSNAVKYSDVGTAIEVRARAAGDHARVEVVDRGIGLPPWEASRVFDPFFRARSSVANAVRGSGIGLALVREYVRTMGGEVFVDSEPGAGSVFGFTLPLDPATASGLAPPPSDGAG